MNPEESQFKTCLVNSSFPFSLLKITDKRYCHVTATAFLELWWRPGTGTFFLFKILQPPEQEVVMFRDSELRAVRLAPAVLVKAPSGHHFI